jgi:hypothetical protein
MGFVVLFAPPFLTRELGLATCLRRRKSQISKLSSTLYLRPCRFGRHEHIWEPRPATLDQASSVSPRGIVPTMKWSKNVTWLFSPQRGSFPLDHDGEKCANWERLSGRTL